MLATPQISFSNQCHSFVSEQHTGECDAPKRTPRSPNAFMLYRSDFIKRRAVPPEVEKRQQNLSRIAGQCWNTLQETEKAIWFSRAAAIRAEYRAKYPSYKANKRPAKDKKREATGSGRSCSRDRTHRMQTHYCEGMFAALRNPISSLPESQANLVFPSPASHSPFSTIASLSPISLPHSLPGGKDSPSASSKHSVIQNPPASSDPEMPQWGSCNIFRDSETASDENGSSPEPCPIVQRYDLASYLAHPRIEQLPGSRPAPLTFPRSDIVIPSVNRVTECRSPASDFDTTTNLAHSSIPSFP